MSDIDQKAELPKGYTTKDDQVFNERGEWVEQFEGKWMRVINGGRLGWWRFHEHYDRNGYCDNPARGY